MNSHPVKQTNKSDDNRWPSTNGGVIRGLKGSYLSYLISAKVNEGKGPFLIITPTLAEAERTLKDINFFLGNSHKPFLFPPWEVLPYENLSPHPDVAAERLASLYKILTSKVDVLVAPISSLMQKAVPKEELGNMADFVAAGEEAPFEEFIERLIHIGYRRTPQVEERGEFSVRGGIVDIFGPAMNSPLRMEFFGDEVESIKEFDLESQRSTGPEIDELTILPAGETILSPGNAKAAAKKIRSRGREMGLKRARLDNLLQGFDEGMAFQGFEFFMADFYDQLSSLFDYLPDSVTTIMVDPEEITERAEEFERSVIEGHEKAIAHDWPFSEPDALFMNTENAMAAINKTQIILAGGLNTGGAEVVKLSLEDNSDLRVTLRGKDKDSSPLEPLASRVRKWSEEGLKVIFTAHTSGQGERLGELMGPHGIDLRIKSGHPELAGEPGYFPLCLGELSHGFRDLNRGLVIITEEEIFGERHKHRKSIRKISDPQLSSFGQLKQEDYIVHIDHGIGIYRGLKKLDAGGMVADYLELEYHGGDKVFAPVDRLNLVQRYAGGDKEAPVLDKLGGTSWERVKSKVKKAVAEMAGELMEIYAAREVMEGFVFSKGGDEFREFEASFEYEETVDQRAAIDEVLRDMESHRPMDRLICGDVGYGKTEVAVRASFKAVMDGRQVAVLVPTTILAQQHHQTFIDRFKGYPIIVEKLTRFCGRAKQQDVLKSLKEGKVDVVIGTHRLLQKDVSFDKLGLIVTDEEQRFGVAHKEKLKKMRKTVDVITLTATPIPRTLHMAMTGVRDLSIISSPPEGRLAIRTSVVKFDEEIIRDAVMRELKRGGQVFFVHNRIQGIENIAARLKAIVPEAKVAIGHGQLAEGQLERVMVDFYEGKVNLLICTTIVESGLDIPTANTIIINNAQNMGLAQLYQLRGRVGRSKHRAYAYLVIPGDAILTRDARKRLQAIQEMTDLSSGFQLASYDLEIRGSGNIVGSEQSGQIEAVGFELFTSMLERAVAKLRGEGLKEEIEPEVRFSHPAFIPEDYVNDTNQRLNLYKRFSSLSDDNELEDMVIEIEDRFGPLPQTVKNFAELISFKLQLKKGMVRKATVSESAISFTFHEKAVVNVDRLLSLVRKTPKKYSLTPDMCFKVVPSSREWSETLKEGKKVLKGIIEYGSFSGRENLD